MLFDVGLIDVPPMHRMQHDETIDCDHLYIFELSGQP